MKEPWEKVWEAAQKAFLRLQGLIDAELTGSNPSETTPTAVEFAQPRETPEGACQVVGIGFRVWQRYVLEWRLVTRLRAESFGCSVEVFIRGPGPVTNEPRRHISLENILKPPAATDTEADRMVTWRLSGSAQLPDDLSPTRLMELVPDSGGGPVERLLRQILACLPEDTAKGRALGMSERPALLLVRTMVRAVTAAENKDRVAAAVAAFGTETAIATLYREAQSDYQALRDALETQVSGLDLRGSWPMTEADYAIQEEDGSVGVATVVCIRQPNAVLMLRLERRTKQAAYSFLVTVRLHLLDELGSLRPDPCLAVFRKTAVPSAHPCDGAWLLATAAAPTSTERAGGTEMLSPERAVDIPWLIARIPGDAEPDLSQRMLDEGTRRGPMHELTKLTALTAVRTAVIAFAELGAR